MRFKPKSLEIRVEVLSLGIRGAGQGVDIAVDLEGRFLVGLLIWQLRS